MTREEANIVGAYTGILMGDFSALHMYIEKILGRPVFTHELGDASVQKEIRLAASDEFLTICDNIKE